MGKAKAEAMCSNSHNLLEPEGGLALELGKASMWPGPEYEWPPLVPNSKQYCISPQCDCWVLTMT